MTATAASGMHPSGMHSCFKTSMTYGSFTLWETDSVRDSDSDPIPVVGSLDWNLNWCNVKTSA